MNDVGIVTVTFNKPSLLQRQIDLLKKFCTDENYKIIVADNSDKEEHCSAIKTIALNNNCLYYRTNIGNPDFSQSHASACNTIYKQINTHNKYLFFIDHDNFPIKKFSVIEKLKSKHTIGLGQIRNGKHYYWAGCFIVDNTKVDNNLVDFSTNSDIGLDTGGNLYKIIDTYGFDNCLFFDQLEKPNPYHSDGYNFYQLIDETFMHFINSSNWNKKTNNEQRINSLFKILEEYVGKNE